MSMDSNSVDSTEIESAPLSETEATTETPSVEAEVSEEASSPAPGEMSPDAAAPVAPAYQPNFKYSIKGKEHEIDEMFRSIIKDEDSEKKVKELFEKAMGLDHVKSDRTAIKDQFEGFKSTVIPYLQTYDQFTTLRDKGNLGAAFKVAGLTDEMIFNYALQKLEMDQNPTLASTYQSQQDQSLRELEMQRQLDQYKQQDEATHLERFTSEFEQSLAGVQELVNQVNSKFGQEDFFREEAINYGTIMKQRGKDVSPKEAVEYVANKYKSFFPSSPVAPSAPAAPQVQQAAPQQRPTTLPNLGSSNQSAIKPKVKSLDDLKKMALEA